MIKTTENRMRPAPFWSWNGELDKKELIRQIGEMAKKGWSGFFMHSRAGLITPYLSKEWFDLVKACAVEARKFGIDAWLYDEDKWPSGFAGGLVAEANPAFRMKAITIISPDKFEDASMNEIKMVEHEGKKHLIVEWLAPLDNPWFNYASYIDTMNPEAVDKFLEITVGGYKKEVGNFFGKEIPGIFTDEPCYLYSGRHVAPNFLPWTTKLPYSFKKEKRYNLLDKIEELFLKKGNYRKTRFDFFDVATQLFVNGWSVRYHKKCKKNKLIYTGHMMAEDTLEEQTRWSGAVMPHYEHMDWPGVDKLSRHTQQTVTIKQVSSVSEQLNKEKTFCEVFGCTGHTFSFKGRRWIHNWEAALGINFVNHHLSHYTMAGERKRDYPPNFFYQQPYWHYEKGMSDYIAKVNSLLTNGKREIDILVLHPIGTAWAEFDVLSYYKNISPSVWSIELQKLADSLLANRLDFHFGDETIINRHGSCKNGRISVGSFTYGTIVVPSSLTWKSSTINLMKRFEQGGGKIIFYGNIPAFVDMKDEIDYLKKFPSAFAATSLNGTISKLTEIYKESIVNIRDIDTGSNAAYLFCHQRTLDNGNDLFFITNTSELKSVNALVSLPVSGYTEYYDWESGKWHVADITSKTTRTDLQLKLEAGEAVALRVNRNKKPLFQKQRLSKQFEHSAIELTNWKVRPLDPNVLRVETIDFSLNGVEIFRNAPVSRAWDIFEKTPDGTPFEVSYHFSIKSIPAGELNAVIEYAKNLDKIKINDHPVKPSGKNWLDVAFQTINISKKIFPGNNKIVISGRKRNNIIGPITHRRVGTSEMPFNQTEIEPIYITGNFVVDNFDNREFSIARYPANYNPDIKNLTNSGFPFFAGRFECKTEFDGTITKNGSQLQFARVSAPCINIRFNDSTPVTLYWAPWNIDISHFVKKGKNKLVLTIPTDLFNLMGPNSEPLGDNGAVNPPMFRDPNRWSPKYHLQHIGFDRTRIVSNT